LLADNCFDQSQFDEAAKYYAQTNRTVELTSLKFISAKKEETLIGTMSIPDTVVTSVLVYLENYLKKFGNDFKTQRTLLLSWLVELNIFRLNKLERLMGELPYTSHVR
jgi:hypothetical protein